MSSSRRSIQFWVSAWLPVVVCVGVIVVESTRWLGSNYTSSPLRWLFQAIFGPVSNAVWDNIHHYIRKSGHFTGYGLLGLAWLRAWWMTLRHFRFFFGVELALLSTALVSALDEWHQTFLPNRTGTPWDVLLDCTGAVVMLSAVYVYVRFFRSELLPCQSSSDRAVEPNRSELG